MKSCFVWKKRELKTFFLITFAVKTKRDMEQKQITAPGLKGFSETSIKRMRLFYEAWCSLFDNRPLPTDDLQKSINMPVVCNVWFFFHNYFATSALFRTFATDKKS